MKESQFQTVSQFQIVTVKNQKAVNMAGMTVTVNMKKKVKVSQFWTVKGVNMAALTVTVKMKIQK